MLGLFSARLDESPASWKHAPSPVDQLSTSPRVIIFLCPPAVVSASVLAFKAPRARRKDRNNFSNPPTAPASSRPPPNCATRIAPASSPLTYSMIPSKNSVPFSPPMSYTRCGRSRELASNRVADRPSAKTIDHLHRPRILRRRRATCAPNARSAPAPIAPSRRRRVRAHRREPSRNTQARRASNHPPSETSRSSRARARSARRARAHRRARRRLAPRARCRRAARRRRRRPP